MVAMIGPQFVSFGKSTTNEKNVANAAQTNHVIIAAQMIVNNILIEISTTENRLPTSLEPSQFSLSNHRKKVFK